MKIEDLKNKTNDQLLKIIAAQDKELKLNKSIIEENTATIEKHKKDISNLKEQLQLYLQRRFGRQSDRFHNPNQISLFDEAEAAQPDIAPAEAAPIETVMIEAHERKKTGRKKLPANIERVRKEIDLPAEEKQCSCGCMLTKIGEEVSEKLDFIPAKTQVIQYARFKYACKSCEEGIKLAPAAQLPLPKCIAAPGLLSHIIVSKYEDHLPLYRQERIIKRMGVDLGRNTLCHWVIKCGYLLQPLINLMSKTIQHGDIGYSDETVLQVLNEPGREAQTKSYMWLFIGGGLVERSFVYQYHPTRSGSAADEFWSAFTGYLHSDGYQAYGQLFKKYDITGVHCWAHVKRKFMDIVKSIESKKPGLAHWAANHINKLYQVEKRCKLHKLTPAKIKEEREKKANPLLVEFKKWLDEKQEQTLESSSIGKAIRYALNHWDNLNHYLIDGRLDIDNNLAERAIKPFATGRKNWLFAATQRGATASANIYSLIETCKFHKKDPYIYFKTVLEKIMFCKTEDDYTKLLPFYIQLE